MQDRPDPIRLYLGAINRQRSQTNQLRLPGNLTGGKNTVCVSVDQDFQHHARIERRLAAPVSFVASVKGAYVQFFDNVTNEVGQMAFGQSFVKIGRQQQL